MSLHLLPMGKPINPAPLAPDAAARLSAADCHAIADDDYSEWPRAVRFLLRAFATCLLVAIAAICIALVPWP